MRRYDSCINNSYDLPKHLLTYYQGISKLSLLACTLVASHQISQPEVAQDLDTVQVLKKEPAIEETCLQSIKEEPNTSIKRSRK